MKLSIIFCVFSFLALSGCADNSVHKPGVLSATPQQTEKNDLADIAMQYLSDNKVQTGIHNPSRDLQLITTSTDKYQTHHLKYNQLFKNVPVWASELIVHIKNKGVYRVDGKAKRIPEDLTVSPGLSAREAEKSAFNVTDGKYASQLMVLVENNKLARLVYRIQVNSGLKRYVAFVDAHTGDVVKTVNAMPTLINQY